MDSPNRDDEPAPEDEPAPNPAAEDEAGQDASEPEPRDPSWLLPIGAMLIVVTTIVLGFFWPGFFVTKVFDRSALENGVRSILVDSYRVPNVTDVYCPSRQKVTAGRSFACIAQIDGFPTQVRVMIRDDSGHYLVNRPN